MAYTAMSAEARKSNNTGAKQTAGNVLTLSLAWAPTEMPSATDMERAARQVLQHLGLSEHEALLVGHNDTAHPHIHIICNLIHPEEGTVGDLRNNYYKLQKRASWYEHADGEIRCPERERNALQRRRGDYTTYQNRICQDASRISLFFEQSDSPFEFVQQLSEMGLQVARGDKNRVVIIDQQGKISNLTRQLPKGTGKREIVAKFGKDFISQLPSATELVTPKRYRSDTPESYFARRLPPDLTVTDASHEGRLNTPPTRQQE